MADKIILGTVQFGLDYGIHNSSGKPSFDTVSDILHKAHQSGIRLLDSAEAYGNAHEIIGTFHQKNSIRFKIVSKYAHGRNDLPKDLKERVFHNLKVLGVESLYAYMFHSFSDYKTHFKSYAGQIEALKAEGYIEKFGVSVYTNQEMLELIDNTNVDLIQLPFNLLDNTQQRGALIAKAKQKGIEIHTRSAFLQGLFFKDPDTLDPKFVSLRSSLMLIHSISKREKISVSDLALNYCLTQSDVDQVLIGVDNVQQLDENLRSTKVQLPANVLHEIDEIVLKEVNMLNPSNWNR